MLLSTFAIAIDVTMIGSFSPMMMNGTHLHNYFELGTHGLILAQQLQNVDLMANVHNGLTDFLKTGKAGALAIGLVMGYTIRGVTS